MGYVFLTNEDTAGASYQEYGIRNLGAGPLGRKMIGPHWTHGDKHGAIAPNWGYTRSQRQHMFIRQAVHASIYIYFNVYLNIHISDVCMNSVKRICQTYTYI